jgi:ribosomal protein S18 acetylase RimI-like enzyme
MVEAITFSIVSATWRDLMPLRRLEEICFDRDAWPLIDLIAVLTMPNIVRLKATSDEHMVGFIAGEPRLPEQIGWITTIGVAPEFRRLGVATSLLDLCEGQMGLPFVRLCVRRSNFGAIRLYSNRGYRQVSVWANYYSGGEDALVLEKKRL